MRLNLGNPIAKGNAAEIYLYDNKIMKLFRDYTPKYRVYE